MRLLKEATEGSSLSSSKCEAFAKMFKSPNAEWTKRSIRKKVGPRRFELPTTGELRQMVLFFVPFAVL